MQAGYRRDVSANILVGKLTVIRVKQVVKGLKGGRAVGVPRRKTSLTPGAIHRQDSGVHPRERRLSTQNEMAAIRWRWLRIPRRARALRDVRILLDGLPPRFAPSAEVRRVSRSRDNEGLEEIAGIGVSDLKFVVFDVNDFASIPLDGIG